MHFPLLDLLATGLRVIFLEYASTPQINDAIFPALFDFDTPLDVDD